MKIIGIALLIISVSALAADTSVDGYFKHDGTYVQPHHQTTPNSTRMDNYSTQGNVNPYTGQQGHVNSYTPPHSTYSAPQPNYGYGTPQPHQKPYGY